ncbi:MAG TPA: hypothetical protein VF721_13405, partial [Pyrinomonadaceae bacterium]
MPESEIKSKDNIGVVNNPSMETKTESPTDMNHHERTFIFATVFAHIGLLLKVGFESQKWTQIEFIFAYSACVLIFIQFLIRYLAITHLYGTEVSIRSWVVSILIVITSLILINSSLYFPFWFLIFGILLILASLKTGQVINSLVASDKNNENSDENDENSDENDENSVERRNRLGEF